MLQTTLSQSAPPTHLLGVLRTLWQWRKPVALTTLAGALLAIVISLLLPAYFTGFTSFVAISPEQVSIESTFGTTTGRVQFYGTGDDIDRLLSIAEGSELVDFMVDSFKLYEVYDIDPATLKGPVYVRKEFMSNYEVERTARDVIELNVHDRSPERAAAMATAARRRIDQLNLALIRSTHQRNASGLEQEVNESSQRLAELGDRLSELRSQSGIYNTEAQSEALATASSSLDQRLATTEARLAVYTQRGGPRDSLQKLGIDLTGLQRARGAIDAQLAQLNGNIGQIENLEEERLQANEAMSENRTRLKQYQSILTGDRRTLEVLEEARVPLVKSYPIRWLIVLIATVLSFIVAVVGVLLIDSGRRYDWRSITQ